MDRVIDNFVRADEVEGNALLLVMPPGTGKTYCTVNWMADYIRSGGERRLIFITQQKKNLPDDHGGKNGELRKAFERADIGNRYDADVLFLAPVTENVLDTGRRFLDDPSTMGAFRDFIDDRDLYTKVRSFFQNFKECKTKAQRDLVVESFRPLESRLRRRIRSILSEHGGKPDELLQYVREQHPWLIPLYPAMEAHEKKVLMLSSAKFIHPFDTIIRPSGAFYESDLLKDSVLIMDEFDSIKLDWLNQLVKKDSAGRIETVDLFSRVYAGLRNRDNHIRQYYRDARAGEPDFDESRSLSMFADRVTAAFEEVYQKHSLAYDFKLDGGEGGFIFRDYNTVTVGKGTRFGVNTDGSECVNRVVPMDPKDPGEGIESLFGDMDRRLRFFERFVATLAFNYQANSRKRGNEITYEQAIRTVLEPFRLDPAQRDHLVKVVMFRRRRGGNFQDPADMTVYARGFSYFDFEDSEDHGLNSHIHQTAYYRSPEMVLLKVMATEGIKMVGISATAEIRSSIRNFDLRYLRTYPQFRQYDVPEDDVRRLDDMFGQATAHYDRVKVHVKVVGDDISQLADSGRVYQRIHNVTSGKMDHEGRRYVRFAVAYREFMATDSIRSMIIFMTRFPGHNTELDTAKLTSICNAIRADMGMERTDEPFVVLKSEDFESSRSQIVERWAKGEKLAVLTTYQTLGAGQNLQYVIPDGVETVSVNDFVHDGPREKDVDAVYLDTPTNILPTTYDPWDMESLARYLFDIGFLLAGQEITQKQWKDCLDMAFQRFRGAPVNPSGLKDSCSVRAGAARDMIQAVGRMCRTSSKSPDIFVMAAEGAAEFLTQDLHELGDRLNIEFVAMHKVLHRPPMERADGAANDIDVASDMANHLIAGYVNYPESWTKDRMDEWKAIRDYPLRYPTVSEGAEGPMAYSLYVGLDGKGDRLPYRFTGDHRRVYLHGPRLDCQVSAESARLPELLSIPGVEQMFDERGYAKTFHPDDRIMCPVVFNNIYKGALGEVVGNAILERWGIKLSEIGDPSKFERFDFVSENGVYVDFKHWKWTPEGLEEDGLEKAFGKRGEIGGTVAVIVNVLKPDYDIDPVPHIAIKDGLTVWTVPYLYDGPDMNREAYTRLMELLS